jgi:hypothetical protein
MTATVVASTWHGPTACAQAVSESVGASIKKGTEAPERLVPGNFL